MDTKQIGKMIRKYRADRGYTQQEFADVMEISRNYMGSIERGVQIPSLDTLIKIANALDVTTDELLMGVVSQARGLQATMLSQKLQGLKDEQITMVLNVADQMAKDFTKLNIQKQTDINR